MEEEVAVRLQQFDALRPRPDLVERVAAVPYDVVDTEEARALAADNPFSLLRVSRPEIEFPAGTDPHQPAIYERAAFNFDRLRRDKALVAEGTPGLYLYRQIMGRHAQRGVVGCCRIEEYATGLIRKHENTRRDKEDDRTRHTLALRANVGPVFLMYRDMSEIDRLTARIESGHALYDFTAPDGVRHTVWRAADPDALRRAFAAVPTAYIADGHHRAAAAVRAGESLKAANPAHRGDEEYNAFLAVLFPASQLQILSYHRLVLDLNGHSTASFTAALDREFNVRPLPDAVIPDDCLCAMFRDGRWHGLALRRPVDAGMDAVARLDVSVLQARLLAPILGIGDPKTDPRIAFMGGIRGVDALAQRVTTGQAAVAFAMRAVTPEQVMRVADIGGLMPPKSTWFEPKLRSGLLIHTF